MKQVTIVGVGALGSHVALFLRNEARLKLIDFDRIEQKNVLSQFHARRNVGKNKARSLEQTMDFLFSGPEVISLPHKLVEDNAEQLLSKTDLVIDCVDNAEARKLIESHKFTPVLHGGLAADGMFGMVGWDDEFPIEGGGEEGATCEDGEHLPFIATTAAYIAKAAQTYLKHGHKLGFMVHPTGAERT
jgi:molybdopterin/thiamine biosynthesis adenylyltransferase